MLLRQVVPAGEARPPEAFYAGLRLGELAPAERPYVFCNFVASADGKASAGGRTAPLGGDGDRAAFHLLRTQADAILAGTGTLEVERYGPMIRSEEMIAVRAREGRAAQPLAVVISRHGEVPFGIPLFRAAESTVVLYVPEGTEIPACEADLVVHRVSSTEFSLADVLRSLRYEHGVASLLCEGGPTMFGALLAEDLVDELFLTLAPTLVGAGEHALTSGPGLSELMALKLVWALEREDHLFLRYARARDSPAGA
jgi:riboflavin biosynthesis pyrimidine reductase